MVTKTTSKKRKIKPLVTPTAELVKLLKKHKDAKWAVPEKFEAIKDYALKITFSREGRNGIMWEGKLYKSGVHILDVEDRGDGGALRFDATKKNLDSWRREETEFFAASQKAYPSTKAEPFAKAIFFLDVIGNCLSATP